MTIRWIDAEGQQRSMTIDGPIIIEAGAGKRALNVRTPGQMVPKQWHWLSPRVIAVRDEEECDACRHPSAEHNQGTGVCAACTAYGGPCAVSVAIAEDVDE